MSRSLAKLEQNLARWREKGWVDETGAAAILEEARANASAGPGLSAVFAILGAALLCLGVAAFVAANWAAIPRPAKLALLIGLLWTAYAAAYALWRRDAIYGAHAAVIVGIGAFGAGIMLIGQMYHLAGEPTGALLVWFLGALATSLLLSSAPAGFFAAGLALLWSEWLVFTSPDFEPHPPFLLAWAAVAYAFWRARWSGGFHVIALGLVYWSLWLGPRLGEDHGFLAPLALGAATFAVGVLFAPRPPLKDLRPNLSRELVVYGFITASTAAIIHHLLADKAVLEAVLILAALIGVIWFAVASRHPTLLWWAYGALSAELLIIYVKTVGSMLGTALFFLVAGLLVCGGAAIAWRLSKRLSEPGASA